MGDRQELLRWLQMTCIAVSRIAQVRDGLCREKQLRRRRQEAVWRDVWKTFGVTEGLKRVDNQEV